MSTLLQQTFELRVHAADFSFPPPPPSDHHHNSCYIQFTLHRWLCVWICFDCVLIPLCLCVKICFDSVLCPPRSLVPKCTLCEWCIIYNHEHRNMRGLTGIACFSSFLIVCISFIFFPPVTFALFKILMPINECHIWDKFDVFEETQLMVYIPHLSCRETYPFKRIEESSRMVDQKFY